VVRTVAIVDVRFEDLDFLTCDLRTFYAPQKLLSLSTEHAATDDFD
jgi:hypothetical protein